MNSKQYAHKLIQFICDASVEHKGKCEYVKMTCFQAAVLKADAPEGHWQHGATNSLLKFRGLPVVLLGSTLDLQYREMKNNPAHIDLTEISE